MDTRNCGDLIYGIAKGQTQLVTKQQQQHGKFYTGRQWSATSKPSLWLEQIELNFLKILLGIHFLQWSMTTHLTQQYETKLNSCILEMFCQKESFVFCQGK